MTKHHLWQGQWIDDAALAGRLEDLPTWTCGEVGRAADVEAVVAAASALSRSLRQKAAVYAQLLDVLRADGQLGADEAEATLSELAEVLSRTNLERKLKSELGSLRPLRLTRRDYQEHLFEAWAPLGFLVHISPQNSLASGFLSLLEGLLSGNVNLLKTGGGEGLFAQHCVKVLGEHDPTGEVDRRSVVARIASKRQDLLKPIFAAADCVAAWGGEEAIEAIRSQLPPGVRLVEWGHKISFIYVAKDCLALAGLFVQIARECCLLEQQACSSPQCLYVETSDYGVLRSFAGKLAAALAEVSPTMPRVLPEPAEQAELSLVTKLHQLESLTAQTEVHSLKAEVLVARDEAWRILIDERPGLVGSPLYRSIWLKPLPRARLLQTLRPMRQYLQTAGLACGLDGVHELTTLLTTAGVDRVRQVGSMLGGYAGEPHDGVYALQRYCRRISVQLPEQARGVSTFDELRKMSPPAWPALPKVTPKEAFHDLPVDGHAPKLYFKSGGSSGKPKLSTYSYAQYDEHMTLGAEGIYAAGFDPNLDRGMNLFFGGGLYGGFISFFSALERLGAVQLPMAAHADHAMVASVIIDQRVNVLFGMPSYLMTLFESCREALSGYRGITKIFFGGEHFTEAQRQYLRTEFGVEVIRSGAYGSVDIGPIGFQCPYCASGVHHVQQQLQYLEILELDSDKAVQGEAMGRLVYSPAALDSNKPRRYEIGDVGHWVLDADGSCACGRLSPRFKLLGRMGDIFRIGSVFLNYQKFAAVLSQEGGYVSEFQLVLEEISLKETLTLYITPQSQLDAAAARALCLEHDQDLNEAAAIDKTLVFNVLTVPLMDLKRTPGSGKLMRVIDRRVR